MSAPELLQCAEPPGVKGAAGWKVRMPAFRLIPRLDKMPRLVAASRTVAGRLALVVVFTALLAATRNRVWWQTGVVLALTSLFPARRKVLLALAALCWIYFSPPLSLSRLKELAPRHGSEQWVWASPLAVAGVLLFAGAYLWLVRRFPASLPGRRPVLVLVAILVALLAALQAPLTGAAWLAVAAVAMVLGQYIWFFGYSLADKSSREATPLWRQVGFWRPFWGFNVVPKGKGAAYLERVEARDDAQLAIVQLKGLKLVLWATALYVVQRVLRRVLYGVSAGPLDQLLAWAPAGLLPDYAQALDQHLGGQPYPLPVRWLVLILHFLFIILDLAVLWHPVIATCRMAGFNAMRNTYRPLTATTVAEFYNRISYYFKELLATFFFYPTYLRYFKRHPRLRLFAATLAAAGLGNFLFLVLARDMYIFEMGLWDALVAQHVLAVYTLVLGTAIALSQVRMTARRCPPPSGFRKVLAVGGVLTFYCFISLLDEPRLRTLGDYGSYFLSLFRP
jgi:hypothetical protein